MKNTYYDDASHLNEMRKEDDDDSGWEVMMGHVDERIQKSTLR